MVFSIRPSGPLRAFFLPAALLVAVTVAGAWVAARQPEAQMRVALIAALGLAAVAAWPLLYCFRARISLSPDDKGIRVRGRFVTRVVDGRRIRSAELYGRPGNQAVAFLDSHNRRVLTLRLVYWSLPDLRRLGDQLGVLIHEPRKSTVQTPAGRGFLPFLERHPNLVGSFIPLMTAVVLIVVIWAWLRLG